MRSAATVVASVLAAAACTATPATVVIEHDRQSDPVVTPDAASTEVADAALTIDAHDAGATSNSDASDASDGGAGFVCSGAVTMGNTSANCHALGACTLSTCADGEAYACAAGGLPASPQNLMKCVYSSADSVHCCEPACVRWLQGDMACSTLSTGLMPKAFSCSTRVSAPSGCIAGPSGSPGVFCCP